MPNVIVNGLYGLGDNIYQRPFVRALFEKYDVVYLKTAWPEIYKDMLDNLLFLKPDTRLRTQTKNINKNDGTWTTAVKGATKRLKFGYGGQLKNSSIIKIMESQVPFSVGQIIFDLPEFDRWELPEQPIAVVRPVTVRTEWSNPARNPLPEYIQEAVWILKEYGYYVISVADIEPGKEEYVSGRLEGCDYYYDKGELSVSPLLGLIQQADLVLGGVGWIVPACLAAHTPLFIVQGGQGGHNDIPRITDSRMDLSMLGYARPDNYCQCTNMKHNCNKKISNFKTILRRYLDGRSF